MIKKTVQHENSHKLYDQMGHPVVNLMESQWKLRQKHDQISHWRESQCRTNIASEERNPKEQDCENQSEVRVNHLSKVVCDRKIITEFTRSISCTRIGYSVLMMDVEVFNTSADGLIERTSSMLDEIK